MTRNGVGRQGVALITTLAIVVIVAALILGSIVTTELELSVTRNDVAATQAQYLAQAGLQSTKARLFQAYRYRISEEGSADACASSFDMEIDFSRTGDGVSWSNNRMALGSQPVFAAGANGALVGFYTVELVRDPVRQNVITIRSLGERTIDATNAAQPLATSRASATFSISTGSGIEMALYAGAGGGNGAVNGNAEIYGGIYIEGDREAYGEDGSQPVVFAPGGTFRQLNGYTPDVLRTGNYNPTNFLDVTSVANLCASLRVAFGSVEMGGSVELGKPHNNLYTVAVGQGESRVTYNNTQIDGDVDDTCMRNLGVCSQEGVTAFDLLEAPRFPRFDEPPANTELCGNVATWRACLQNEAIADGSVIEFDASGGLIGPMAAGISPLCKDVLESARAASEPTLRLGTDELNCTYTVNGVTRGFHYTYAGGRGKVEMHGNLNIRGLNVVFEEPTEYAIRSGAGNAGLTVESDHEGDIEGGGSIVVSGDFVPEFGSRYPTTVLALVAEHNLALMGGQFVTVAAPVYAGRLFRIRANTTLVGQVIADSFCSTNNADSSPTSDDCNPGGAPPRIIYSSAGNNRPLSYQAVAKPGGTPTYALLGYEQR